MEELFTQVWQILLQVVTNLTNPEAWKVALGNPAMIVAAFVVLNLIVFTETGLLIGFFLPGDSLLVTAGIVGHSVDWPLLPLLATLCASAILGDTVGYWIGYKAGPAIFNRPTSRFFKQQHLLAAKDFYERHGGKTVIIARFIPIIRTFAPVVAGAGRMAYRRFIMFNVVGGISWIVSMLLLGYTLHLWLDPLLKPVFGENFKIEKHIDKVVIVIVGLSVLPIVWKWYTHRSASARTTALVTAPTHKTPLG
jgi:membrane-associated protein